MSYISRRFLEIHAKDVTSGSYHDIKYLIEEKNASVEDVIKSIQRQLEICFRVKRTGEPEMIRAQSEDGQPESITLTTENVDDFIKQAHFLLVGLAVYCEEANLEGIPRDIQIKIPDIAVESLRELVGLGESEDPSEETSEEPPEELDVFRNLDRSKLKFRRRNKK